MLNDNTETSVQELPDAVPTFLGKGADATVWRSADGASVVKQYLDKDRDLASSRARQEFIALERARRVLESIDGISCPQPYSVNGEEGELRMEYRDAVHLDVALRARRFGQRDEIIRLASLLAIAINRLTQALSMNQLDFAVRNTLVSRDGAEITLIDFASRVSTGINTSNARAIEVALASFLCSTITYQLHQETLRRRTVSRRLRLLSKSLFEIVASQTAVDRQRVKALAWQYYWRQSRNRGWKRYIWFVSAGAVLFALLLHRATRQSATSSQSKDTDQISKLP